MTRIILITLLAIATAGCSADRELVASDYRGMIEAIDDDVLECSERNPIDDSYKEQRAIVNADVERFNAWKKLRRPPSQIANEHLHLARGFYNLFANFGGECGDLILRKAGIRN